MEDRVKIEYQLRSHTVQEIDLGRVRGPNRPVVKKGKILFSLSSVILFNMIGVDPCVFLIFTTRVDPNKRNKHPLKD